MTTLLYKKTIRLIIITLILSITSCIDESFDLSDGINTEMSIGGDSLSIPIAKSKVYLDSMLNKEQIAMLSRLTDSTYAFNLVDSMKASVSGIKPVSLAFNSISVTPITSSFSNIKLPEFIFNAMSVQSAINIPQISIDSKLIQPINTSYTKDFPIVTAAGIKKQLNTSINKVKAGSNTIGPFRNQTTRSIDESFQYIFPKELKRINKIMFTGTKVTLTFDKTKTNQLGLISQNDTIKLFRIDFPSEFRLSTPVGLNSAIEGTSFVIRNAALAKNVNVFTASFYIESLDLANYYEFESLLYSKTISYSIDYNFIGEAVNASALNGQNVEYTVGLTATPTINDAEIETNAFQVTIPNGEIAINKEITNIPDEISQISTVTFNTGANLQLSILDPNIFPFSFTAGQCQVTLPQTFGYNTYSGLNTTSKVLTVPYSSLFGSKTIGVSGATINKYLAENQTSFTITDKLQYSTSGLTIGAQSTTLKTLQGMTGKLMKMTGNCSGLTVKDAALSTRRISVDIPLKTTAISMSKFISTDVKKVYSATLKTPASINFGLSISNLPPAVDSVFFENFTVKLPDYLKFKTGDVNSQNQVILNRGFKVSNGFVKTLTLEKIDFGTAGLALTNGVFALNDAVTMIGKIYVKGTNLNSSDLGTISIKPTINVDNISLSIIEGEITPTIAPIVKIKSTNFPAFMTQNGAKLDLQNPMITVEVGNSLGIAVDATVTIVPKKAGVIIPDATINSQLTIPAAQLIGTTSWNKFIISKSNTLISGYQNIVIPTLPNLFQVAPDEIDIIVSPKVTGSKQLVDLYSTKNQIDVKYAINVPLDFGSEFSIQYNDTLINLKSQLSEIIKYTREVNVTAIFDNKIPLNLNYVVTPLDINNKSIQGITITTTDSIKSCNLDGSAQRSTIKLNIKETSSGALDKLEAFKFSIAATKNSTIAGMPLKTSQYFSLELRVMIPDGLKINQSN